LQRLGNLLPRRCLKRAPFSRIALFPDDEGDADEHVQEDESREGCDQTPAQGFRRSGNFRLVTFEQDLARAARTPMHFPRDGQLAL
jgi:hypothetical protein